MRVLAAVGICNESGIHKYSPNDVTKEFASEGIGDGVKFLSARLGQFWEPEC